MPRGRPYDWVKLLFSREEKRVLRELDLRMRSPVRELDPPQREEYDSEMAYYFDLRDYVRRVIAHDVMES